MGATHQINRSSTCIDNDEILGWLELMNVWQMSTVDCRRFGFRDDP
jgi:hypothetical protein